MMTTLWFGLPFGFLLSPVPVRLPRSIEIDPLLPLASEPVAPDAPLAPAAAVASVVGVVVVGAVVGVVIAGGGAR